MSDGKRNLDSLIHHVEGRFDELKKGLGERFGSDGPLMIVPYMGYGSDATVRVSGRVLVNPGMTTYRDNEDLWDNLGDMYRRFESDELPFPHIRAQYEEVTAEATGDEEGFFLLNISLKGQLHEGTFWHDVDLLLLDQPEGDEDVRATGKVMVPSPAARFGVISDIDDTVIYSHATDFLNMARTVILQDASERTPFPGVAAFYRALSGGTNPFFYVSSSPWNMYDLFVELFELQGIPYGPFLLRDWGIKPGEYLPREHLQYKLAAIREILDFYAHMPFILIGDSGQKDPEIYRQLIELYPGRIQAVYIRHVDQDEAREQEVRELAEAVHQSGTPILLAEDTQSMAKHAAQKGWITERDISEVVEEMGQSQ